MRIGTVQSNDNDFDDAGVEWHTTGELLKMLGTESARRSGIVASAPPKREPYANPAEAGPRV